MNARHRYKSRPAISLHTSSALLSFSHIHVSNSLFPPNYRELSSLDSGKGRAENSSRFCPWPITSALICLMARELRFAISIYHAKDWDWCQEPQTNMSLCADDRSKRGGVGYLGTTCLSQHHGTPERERSMNSASCAKSDEARCDWLHFVRSIWYLRLRFLVCPHVFVLYWWWLDD